MFEDSNIDPEETEGALPFCLAIVADPMEEPAEDGGREYEILDTGIYGVVREGMFFTPFSDIDDLSDFVGALQDYIESMKNGTLEMEELLSDDEQA